MKMKLTIFKPEMHGNIPVGDNLRYRARELNMQGSRDRQIPGRFYFMKIVIKTNVSL